MADDGPRSTFQRAADGEPVLDQLLVENLPRLRAFVRAHMQPELRQQESAADLVQSVCHDLLQERGYFDFRGEAEFRAWLFTAALNRIRAKHRFLKAGKRDRARAQPGSSQIDPALLAAYSTMTTPSAAAHVREQIVCLEAALDRLTPEHRSVIALARLAELPLAEVARAMQRSLDATRMLLGRALRNLAAEMRKLKTGPDG